MPSVTYNGQSFAIDGRRLWILGASIDYARVPRELWANRIAAAKQAGFNTIETCCPWCVHEPRPDRFMFDDNHDVREFVMLCARAGMRVVLRPGPYIGSRYDGGGLPGWLTQRAGARLREADPAFLERVTLYFRKLLALLEDLQATKPNPLYAPGGGRVAASSPGIGGGGGGPIILLQSEHAWLCANPDEAERYLREMTRIARESGFTVPIINANDLWQESPGTIDTWRGNRDLLAHLRQLRSVQPEAPRVLSEFDPGRAAVWGHNVEPPATPEELVYELAQCLAAGAQPIVRPFAGGTNFGFLGGRLAGGPDRFVTTSAAAWSPLGENGTRGPRFNAIRRLLAFANSFDYVFAEVAPERQPIVAAPSPSPQRGAGDGVAVVPLEGPQGRVVFVFARGEAQRHEGKARKELHNAEQHHVLLLDNGVRMPVELGDQRVGWYLLDVDLRGAGRLDYSNLMPWAVIGPPGSRSILVLHGPAGSIGYVAINGTPLRLTVPDEQADQPFVAEHKGITVVVFSQSQVDRAYHDGHMVYIGVDGFDAGGRPIAHSAAAAGSWVIARGGEMRKLADDELSPAPGAGSPGKRRGATARRGGPGKRPAPLSIGEWSAASAALYATGQSPRYATLDGPETLVACGAPTGYGWYCVRLKPGAARKRLCHLPHAADRVHLFLDGKPLTLFGAGPGASADPFELKVGRGDAVIAALVDNLGCFAEGNDMADPKGIFGHLYEVKPIRTGKPKVIEAAPVDPFALRSYIAHRASGTLSETRQLAWAFTHTRKTPILIDVRHARISGTFVLNDKPAAYFAGATGACHARLLFDGETLPAPKRGKNTLRFAPDPAQNQGAGSFDEMAGAAALYECVDGLSASASWSFAKWEPPLPQQFEPVARMALRDLRGFPCWWKAAFASPRAAGSGLWFDTSGMSKGQVFINGRNIGRYFTATASGKAVGPQTRLYVPEPWLRSGGGASTSADAENEILIFDEHGFDPDKCRLVVGAGDEFEG
jgi:beta-galactosidase